jgi:hypothetical protein
MTLYNRRQNIEVATKRVNEMTEIVEAGCVARIGDRHTALQHVPRTLESASNQILMRRHSNQLAKYACEQKDAHPDFQRKVGERVLRRRIGIHQLAGCAYSLRVPA